MPEERPFFLILAPSFPPAYKAGGPARTLEALTNAYEGRGNMAVVTSAYDIDGQALEVAADRWIESGEMAVFYASSMGKVVSAIFSAPRKPDVFYLNSIFNVPFSLLPRAVRLLCAPRSRVLLAPRGELDPGALNLKKKRKSLFLGFSRALGLVCRRPIVFHASSQLEAANIRAALTRDSAVLIRENETQLERFRAPLPGGVERRDQAAFIFVGRISPKKGLLQALQALSGVNGRFIFDIYGPEEDARYASECRNLAATITDGRVNFCGALPHHKVVDTFSHYDAFIFPTAGENFGHVIAESLAAGCSVIVSDKTPWSTLLASGGGQVFPVDDVRALRGLLQEAVDAGRAWRIKEKEKARDAFLRWLDKERPSHVLDQMAAFLRV